jgi:SAM-dependent methyltransferase
VTLGLPFCDREFDVVYHSHVLEHLTPDQGVRMIEECFRVLRPGGIMRVVVPDLERIAQLYLEMHVRAWEGDLNAKTDYSWMKLELLDQLVRECSGGRMGKFMANPQIQNSEFVRSRVGGEYWICRIPAIPEDSIDASRRNRLATATRDLREKFAKRIVRWLLGARAESALDEGLFRSRGEVHRWMYDRYSLREICEGIGFCDFRVIDAHESQIANFNDYGLDVVRGEIRKPDSLFAECRKDPDNFLI